ncbi:MAG: Holliday junction resolvase-like protein [Anaerolineales bacterium]|nr:Holliday junction resolvase-like protein [Anaerolineales bacterium]
MENINIWPFILIITIVLFFVMAMALTIGYFWALSKTKSALLKQNEAVFKQAQEQLQSWKDQDLISIKQQIYDAAKGQTIQEMQEQVQKWQQNELQQIKQQMFEALRGQAIREAQEQLVKWRSGELENSKRQIWDVLSKEATNTLEQWKVETEKEIRKDAIDKSQSVTMGKMTEHMVPYLPGFGFNPTDARFIGSPIDLVVFDGLGDGDIRKIVFVEIKTGVSTLSTRERIVRDAIIAGKIEWMEVKVNLENPDIVREVKSRKRLG